MNEFLATHPLLSLMIAGQLGMLAHWLKRYLRDQTALSLVQFFRANGRATLGSMLVLASTIVGTVTTGVVEASHSALATAFLAGFNLNSIFTPHEPK